MKTYYMFGDSLMRGVMPDEAWNYHSSDAIGFEKMQAQYNMKFLNFAMPTFTSERVKMWLTQVISSHLVPDVAFLECGGNDCDYDWKSICEGRCDYEHRHRVAPQDFKKAYYSKDGMHPNEAGYALIRGDFEKYFASAAGII